jgi:hypothetical protein
MKIDLFSNLFGAHCEYSPLKHSNWDSCSKVNFNEYV